MTKPNEKQKEKRVHLSTVILKGSENEAQLLELKKHCQWIFVELLSPEFSTKIANLYRKKNNEVQHQIILEITPSVEELLDLNRFKIWIDANKTILLGYRNKLHKLDRSDPRWIQFNNHPLTQFTTSDLTILTSLLRDTNNSLLQKFKSITSTTMAREIQCNLEELAVLRDALNQAGLTELKNKLNSKYRLIEIYDNLTERETEAFSAWFRLWFLQKIITEENPILVTFDLTTAQRAIITDKERIAHHLLVLRQLIEKIQQEYTTLYSIYHNIHTRHQQSIHKSKTYKMLSRNNKFLPENLYLYYIKKIDILTDEYFKKCHKWQKDSNKNRSKKRKQANEILASQDFTTTTYQAVVAKRLRKQFNDKRSACKRNNARKRIKKMQQQLQISDANLGKRAHLLLNSHPAIISKRKKTCSQTIFLPVEPENRRKVYKDIMGEELPEYDETNARLSPEEQENHIAIKFRQWNEYLESTYKSLSNTSWLFDLNEEQDLLTLQSEIQRIYNSSQSSDKSIRLVQSELILHSPTTQRENDFRQKFYTRCLPFIVRIPSMGLNQFGVFASTTYQAGEIIMPYLGQHVSAHEKLSEQEIAYTAQLDNTQRISAFYLRGLGSFINSIPPASQTENDIDNYNAAYEMVEGQFVIKALRPILPGEAINVDYRRSKSLNPHHLEKNTSDIQAERNLFVILYRYGLYHGYTRYKNSHEIQSAFLATSHPIQFVKTYIQAVRDWAISQQDQSDSDENTNESCPELGSEENSQSDDENLNKILKSENNHAEADRQIHLSLSSTHDMSKRLAKRKPDENITQATVTKNNVVYPSPFTARVKKIPRISPDDLFQPLLGCINCSINEIIEKLWDHHTYLAKMIKTNRQHVVLRRSHVDVLQKFLNQTNIAYLDSCYTFAKLTSAQFKRLQEFLKINLPLHPRLNKTFNCVLNFSNNSYTHQRFSHAEVKLLQDFLTQNNETELSSLLLHSLNWNNKVDKNVDIQPIRLTF